MGKEGEENVLKKSTGWSEECQMLVLSLPSGVFFVFANVREGELFCELESCVFVSLERNISWLAVLGSSIYLAILETGGHHHGF